MIRLVSGIQLFTDGGEEDIPDMKLPDVAAHVVDTKASHFDSSTFIRYRLVGVLEASDLRIFAECCRCVGDKCEG
jgi:hypothetical protein